MARTEKTINKVYKVFFKKNIDERGSLIAIEGEKYLKFRIRRIFYIYGIEPGLVRGQHANKLSTMCFISIKGECKVFVDNGKDNKTFILDDPAVGLICEPMTWKKIYDFSSDCILMVICDTNYDAKEYISSYDDFKEETKND
jgi:dTDP-4-dehydrorhamnose 3,5-epimerase-like enzyme